MVVLVDPFDAVFGAGIFGEAVFAVVDTPRRVPPGRRGLIGGSGFPPSWIASRFDLLKKRKTQVDDSDVEDLMALGMFDE